MSAGTADLYAMFLQLQNELEDACDRERALLLSCVDRRERLMGYGQPGQQPRTAQIRQWWKDQGEPPLNTK